MILTTQQQFCSKLLLLFCFNLKCIIAKSVLSFDHTLEKKQEKAVFMSPVGRTGHKFICGCVFFFLSPCWLSDKNQLQMYLLSFLLFWLN